MKTSLYLIICLFVSSFFSCQDESNGMGERGVGYLTLNVGTSSATNTRAAEYNPKQIAVQIVNLGTEAVVEETEDWETWEGEKFALETGTYGVYASSAGFDGSSPEFEKPYYTGADTVDIEPNTSKTAKIKCTLANVKLTVDFSFFKENDFKAASVEVGTGGSSLTFSMGMDTEDKEGYFPVKPLTANLTVTNKNGTVHTLKTLIEDAEARDHIILKYKSGESEQGSTGITVTVDESTKTYTYTIPVELKEVAAGLEATSVNAWSKFAYLEGTATVKGMELNISSLKLQYKTAGASEWISLDATIENDVYKAKATGLTPATDYQYRMYYKNADTEYVSDTIAFTTEEATELPYGNFDDWHQSGKTWYTGVSSDPFWDSSNPGTTTGLGALVNINPTTGNSEMVRDKGEQAYEKDQVAELKTYFGSAFGFGKLAAASLYVGQFNTLVNTSGAKLDFGRPFTSRPIALKGWYHYTPETIDDDDEEVGKYTPSMKGQTDLCSIYIILSKGTYQLDNTDTNTLLSEEKVFDMEQFIAYGELPMEQCRKTDGWVNFNIPLKYKADKLDEKPTHLIIVCSSSKYGDYFTGAVGSVMYLDDFSLVYDGTPTIWE